MTMATPPARGMTREAGRELAREVYLGLRRSVFSVPSWAQPERRKNGPDQGVSNSDKTKETKPRKNREYMLGCGQSWGFLRGTDG